MRSTNTTHADTLIIKKVISEEIPAEQAVPIFMVWTADKVPTITLLDLMQVSLCSIDNSEPYNLSDSWYS